jgi:UDP-N-acetylglucosamine pyrophosphorylase
MSKARIFRCPDCDYFIPVDVFKGICHITKDLVMMENEICKEFAPVKKCKFCRHYTEKEEDLGLCKGKVLTYPDLVSKTCEMFEWKADIGRLAR